MIGMICATTLDGPAQIILNEIVAKNTLLRDSLGEYNDWIEIYNPSGTDYDLKDHYLSDDPEQPTKWQFPDSLLVPAEGYLLIFASGNNGIFEDQAHTSFKLSSNEGEALSIIAPDGQTIIHSLPQGFPPLQEDQSFGRVHETDPPEFVILETPSPGARNSRRSKSPELSSFEASSLSIDRGEKLTLSWTGAAADRLILFAGSNPPTEAPLQRVQTLRGESGSIEVSPFRSVVYHLIAQNNWSEISLQQSVEVTQTLKDFSFKPNRIVQGGKTVVRWSLKANESIDVGDGYGDRTFFPYLFTPFNETFIPEMSSWRYVTSEPEASWKLTSYDDTSWLEGTSSPDHNATFARKTFTVSDPTEILKATIRLRASGFFGKFYLNGQEFETSAYEIARINDNREMDIDPVLLREGDNVIAVEGSGVPADLSFTGWRRTDEETEIIYQVQFISNGEMIDRSVPITVLPPGEPLPLPAPLVINEIGSLYNTPEINPIGEYVEILNYGSTEIDLANFQIVGASIADLGKDGLVKLQSQSVAIVEHYEDLSIKLSWPGTYSIAAVFEDSDRIFYGSNDPTLAILDPLGRSIDQVFFRKLGSGTRYGDGFIYQRIDPEIPFSAPGNIVNDSRGVATPGEPFFSVEQADFETQFLEAGEPASFSWKFSHPITFELVESQSGLRIPLQGAKGEVNFQPPLNTSESFNWRLLFQGEQSTFSNSPFGGTRAPQINQFSADKRVYRPGEAVSLFWKTEGSLLSSRVLVNEEELRETGNSALEHTPLDIISGERLNYTLLRRFYGPDPVVFQSSKITILFEDEDFSYARWRDQHGLPPEMTGDFDKDLLPDLLEYAIGTNPKIADSSIIQLQRDDQGDLIVSFPHNLLAPDVDLSIEISPDLESWPYQRYGFTFLDSLAPADSFIANDRYRLAGGLTNKNYYFRLRAILR